MEKSTFVPPAVVCTCWLEAGENNYQLKQLPVYDKTISPALNVFIHKNSMFNRVNCTFIEPVYEGDTEDTLRIRIKESTRYILSLFPTLLNKNLVGILGATYEQFKYLKIVNRDLVNITITKDGYEISITADPESVEMYNKIREGKK